MTRDEFVAACVAHRQAVHDVPANEYTAAMHAFDLGLCNDAYTESLVDGVPCAGDVYRYTDASGNPAKRCIPWATIAARDNLVTPTVAPATAANAAVGTAFPWAWAAVGAVAVGLLIATLRK